MSALILASLLLVMFEVMWANAPGLRPYRWHFRAMLALFWSVVGLLAAGAAFNLAPGLYFNGVPRFASDAMTYQQQAAILADHLREGSFRAFLAADFFNYPRLLAVLYVVFGEHATVGGVFNAVFYLSSLIAIFCIARQLFDDRIALLAAWLFACSPTFLLYATQTMRWPATTAGLHVAVLGTLLLTGSRWPAGYLLSVLGFGVLLSDLPYISRLYLFVVAAYALIVLLYGVVDRQRLMAAARVAVLAMMLVLWYQWTWPWPTTPIQDERTAEAASQRTTALQGAGPISIHFLVSHSLLDRLIAPVLQARQGFLDDTRQLRGAGVAVGTAIEAKSLTSFREFVENLPAAFRVVLTEPTIPRLLAESGGASRLRKIAVVEMLFYYALSVMAFWGLVVAISASQVTSSRTALIVVLLVGSYVLLGTTILNGGTLHRLRQPYVGFLAVFAAGAIVDISHRLQWRKRPVETSETAVLAH